MKGSRKLTVAQMETHAQRRVRLGLALGRARKALGLTQREVGEHLGLGDKTICAIERGRKWPQVGDLPDWCLVLRVETGWFIEQMMTTQKEG